MCRALAASCGAKPDESARCYLTQKSASTWQTAEQEGSRIRVLIADRSLHFRGAVMRVLDTYANCTIVGEASNLPEAVNLAAARRPDLALLDFDLVANEKGKRRRRLYTAPPDAIKLRLFYNENLALLLQRAMPWLAEGEGFEPPRARKP